MRLEGCHLLIAGASHGLGRELAIQLAGRNCRLTLFARGIEALREDPRLAPHLGTRINLVAGDVCDPAAMERLAGAVKDAGPDAPLDGVICTVGVSRPDLIEDLDVERTIDTLRTNLEGPLRLFYRFLPDLMARPGSFIAGFTSMAGDRGMPRGHGYCASKAGLDRLLDCLRIDLWDRGVRVYTVVPGYIETPMTAQNRFPMPGIWPLERGARFLIDQFERERLIIRFPWYHSLGMRLLGLLPNRLYWWLANRQRPQVKIHPQSSDRFSWRTPD